MTTSNCSNRYLHRPLTAIALVVTLTILATSILPVTSAQAREIQERFTFDAKSLEVANMIGHVQVVQAQGNEFKIDVFVRGEDADDGVIEFVSDEGRVARLAVVFPIDDQRKYVYPELGRSSKCTFSYNDDSEQGDSWLKKVFDGISGKRITVSGRGRGMEIWVDLVIEVPEGHSLLVENSVGKVDAENVVGDLNLDTASGAITARDIEGDLICDTGSGSVSVIGVKGEVSVDTGSGSVEVTDCTGSRIHVDTGSGGVEVDQVVCRELNVDTGSGGVDARGIEADEARIDTGSGGITLQLDKMGDGRFVLDTGSGGIKLILPLDASARISADTGSGRVRIDAPDADVRHKERNEAELVIGDGEARVSLDAGSGSITITQK